jgi:hypothetical protein
LTVRKISIAWLILAAVLSAILWQINVPRFLGLVRHGERATGEVSRLDCEKHAQASYTFTIEANRYSGTDEMVSNCDRLQPGDRISIYYDVTNPTTSSAREPRAALINELITIGIGCLLFPPMAIAAFALWSRRNKGP